MFAPIFVGPGKQVVVGIAASAHSDDQEIVLATYSLGSCLGISIYDPVANVGGLLHCMLPDSGIDPGKAIARPAMFVDSGLQLLLHNFIHLKGDPQRASIGVAGGAQILDGGGLFSIGQQNWEAAQRALARLSLRFAGEQIGGMVSRSMGLNLATGEVRLKIPGQPKEAVLCKS